MILHCRSTPWRKGCGGFLKLWEEDVGRLEVVYHCDCNKCGWKISQKGYKNIPNKFEVVAVGKRIEHGMAI